MTGIEDQLQIQLTYRDRTVRAVRIISNRPVKAAMVFVGKTIAETRRMIPLLFSICGTAQACAATRACEQALGIRPDTHSEQRRDALVNMETLREHMWRILLDWPAFYGGEPDKTALAQMVAIQRDYQQAICAGGDVFTVGGADSEVATDELAEVQARLAQFLQRTVFAQSPSEWLKLQEPQVFQTWAGQQRTIAARLIDHVFDSGWCASGSCNSLALPVIEYNLLAEAMQDSAFISQPQWRGHCCETTSLTRRDSPLLKNIESRYRNGLLMRLAAHLTEVAQIAEEMAISSSTAGRPGQPPSAAYFRRGIGRVAAARGELVHRVDLAHGAVPEKTVIDDYRILAPTEWNFHPQGIVNKALCSLKGDLDQVKRQAKLLITTIDPCVAFDLVIIEETQ